MTVARYEKFINYTFPHDRRGKPKKEVSHVLPAAQKASPSPEPGKAGMGVVTEQKLVVAERMVSFNDGDCDPALEYLESIAQSLVVPARLFLDLSVGSPGSDAFDCLPVKGSKYVSAAINFYISMWAPFQIDQGNPLVDQTFPLAVQTPRLFEALLAMCHAYYGTAANGSVWSGRARYHHSRAVRMVENAMLAGVVDDAMIMTLLYMMEFDFCCDDKIGYEAHRKQLWQVIGRRDGLGHCGLHDSLKSSLLRAESIGDPSVDSDFPYSPSSKPAITDAWHPEAKLLRHHFLLLPPPLRELAFNGLLNRNTLLLLGNLGQVTSSLLNDPNGFIEIVEINPSDDVAISVNYSFAKSPATAAEHLCLALLICICNPQDPLTLDQSRLTPLHHIARQLGTQQHPLSERDTLIWLIIAAGVAAVYGGVQDRTAFINLFVAWLNDGKEWRWVRERMTRMDFYQPLKDAFGEGWELREGETDEEEMEERQLAIASKGGLDHACCGGHGRIFKLCRCWRCFTRQKAPSWDVSATELYGRVGRFRKWY